MRNVGSVKVSRVFVCNRVKRLLWLKRAYHLRLCRCVCLCGWQVIGVQVAHVGVQNFHYAFPFARHVCSVVESSVERV